MCHSARDERIFCTVANVGYGFSALQRAEIAEIRRGSKPRLTRARVSVLFNEPKLLKSTRTRPTRRTLCVSVLFSEPKIPQSRSPPRPSSSSRVSVLFSEPKIPQSNIVVDANNQDAVSVLFSEPKIPQFKHRQRQFCRVGGFSALQRAENSSISPNLIIISFASCFSALQRAENSSIKHWTR